MTGSNMKNHRLASHRPATGRTGSRRAAVAMVARHNATLMQLRGIEVSDVRGKAIGDRHVEHLIEVAIIQSAVPAHRQRVPAHDAGRSRGIERVRQPLHVPFIVAALDKKFEKAAYRHVGNGVEAVEFDAMTRTEFLPELRFNG